MNTDNVVIPVKKITRKGAGRTKGSFSFVSITMKELNLQIPNEDETVIVSRKFAESRGIRGLPSEPAGIMSGRLAGKAPGTEVKVKAIEL